jgi:acyl-CoA thioesterase-1
MTPSPHRRSAAPGVSYRLPQPRFNPALLFATLLTVICAIGAPVPARSESPLQIVAIGDSLTASSGLSQSEGLVPQLQRWLDIHAAMPVTVINMGISGDTTTGGRLRLDWALAGGADAVILELGANDMLRGIDPAVSRANLEDMLSRLAQRGVPVLLSGMRSSTNFGPEYKRDFDAIYPSLAEEFDLVFDPFFFDGLVDRRELFLDGLHPNAAGVGVIVERLGPRVLELIERVNR